jgi:ATP-binding cassette subfamily G (WHITE) protein 2 (PDR)
MQPDAGQTCGEYLSSYVSTLPVAARGSIYNPSATSDCQYCSVANADQFLASVSISYTTRWRDYGIGFSYIVFNISMAVLLYYLIRVRRGSGKGLGERLSPLLALFRKDASKENKGAEKKKAPQDPAEPILPK